MILDETFDAMTAHHWLRTISCVSLLATSSATAATFGNFTYTDDGSTVTITDCTATGAVAIPSMIGGKPVTTIGQFAFQRNSGITAITIPDSVTRIETHAFMDCDGLVSMEFPSSVTFLGTDALKDCGNLSSVNLPVGLTSIADGLFHNCRKLTDVTLPDTITSIGSRAFDHCNALQTVGLHANLNSIGEHAFSNSGIASIDLPESLTQIGSGAFHDCDQLVSIRIPDSVTSIGTGLFLFSNQLKTVELSKGLKVLPTWTFGNCPLETLVVPAGVETIDDYCFVRCRQLSKLVLPASLKRVGIEAFLNCDSLTKLRFPSNLRKLDDGVFYGSGLLEIRFDGNAPDITVNTFSEANRKLKILHPDSSKGFTWPTWEGFSTATVGPEIQVEDQRGSVISNRVSTQSFGGRVVGYPRMKVYTIRNVGTHALKKLAVELLANDGGDFTATTDQRGASLEPGQAMKVKVTFRPTGTYERRATLKIHSTDSNENPVTLKLRGLGM